MYCCCMLLVHACILIIAVLSHHTRSAACEYNVSLAPLVMLDCYDDHSYSIIIVSTKTVCTFINMLSHC